MPPRSIFTSLRYLRKVPQSTSPFKSVGWRPVLVLSRGLCDKKVPPEVPPVSHTVHNESNYGENTQNGLRNKWNHYIGEGVAEVRGKHGVRSYTNGLVYEGEFVDDMPNGQGKLTWPGGSLHEGKFEDGVLFEATRSVDIYGLCMEGNLVSGKLHGMGKIKVANRSVVEGKFFNGELVGHGKMTLADGAVHEGELKTQMFQYWYELHGKGTIKKADGTFVEGNFNNGLLHGYGKFTEPDGSYLEGMFELGKICGWCKSSVMNVGSTEGRRINNEWVGSVKITTVSFTSEGSFLSGKEHSVWTYHLKNGMNILGTYDNGVECGRWTFALPSGETFERNF